MTSTAITLNSRNTAIDVGRFICAFLVVALHTSFPVPYVNTYLASVGKIAVPFFLIVSGFYLYSADDSLVFTRAKRGVKKLVVIIAQAMVVYGLLRLIKQEYFHIDISSQAFKILPFILVNDSNFTEHLWYCFAYLYVLLILMAVSKYRHVDFLLYALPVLFTIHFTFTLWSRFVPIAEGKNWYELNWLVIALPFVIIGMPIRKHLPLIGKVNVKSLLATMSILLTFIFFEHYAFKQFAGKGPGIFAISFLAIATFIYCAQNGTIFGASLDAKIGLWGRDHALNIYIYHILVRESLALAEVGLWANNTICVFIISLFLSMITIKIKGLMFISTGNAIN
ncbi:MAG: acyltransferase [Glaciimonas sp.]|nr:acyltransferase [Glaciimonas sp.]